MADEAADALVPTGSAGLDEILRGGWPSGSIVLVEGGSGAGKTMLALQFAWKGILLEERVLYVALSESKRDLVNLGSTHGWDTSRFDIVEGITLETTPTSMFHPSEVELTQTLDRIREEVDRGHPQRVVIDSLAEIRLTAETPLRFRRELLMLKQFLAARNCTALLLDEPGVESSPRTLVDGVLYLEQFAPDYGKERRRLRVAKLRGREYSGGFHDYTIRTGAVAVFPRLVAAEHRTDTVVHPFSSGIQRLDEILDGGFMSGTGTLLIGPAGAGKSSLATQYVVSAARRGENGCVFVFDERPAVFRERARALGLELDEHLDSGRVCLKQVDPAELLPGEFAAAIRREVQSRHIRVLVIDSLNGYLNATPGDRYLLVQLHELLTYLGQMDVSTFLIMGQAGVLERHETPANTTYLADNVILLRYFENAGEVRRAISIVKKRSGRHASTIHELSLSSQGIGLGPPLQELQGVLTGVPRSKATPPRRSRDKHVPPKRT